MDTAKVGNFTPQDLESGKPDIRHFIIAAVVGLGLGWFFGNWEFALFLAVFLPIALGIRHHLQKQEKAAAEAKRNHFLEPIKSIIDAHIATLCRKYEQLVYKDDYGDWIFDDWRREKKAFIERKICRVAGHVEYESSDWFDIEDAIDHAIDAYKMANISEDLDLNDISDPLEYEKAIAAQLRDLGWDARTTVASGDQGVDVLATKAGKRVVIQCKLYSQPVGNKAVQEVFAAKKHEQADFAAVVTNASFTKSARQLAISTRVFLLHHDELPDFSRMLELDI